jgi:hypothetical protein
MQIQRISPLLYGFLCVSAVLLVGAFFAVLAGAGTALAGPIGAAVFAAVLLGLVAMFMPLHGLVIGLVVATFLITGQLIYFGRIDKALWFPFVLGVLMWVRYPLDKILGRVTAVGATPQTPTPVKILIGLYFSILIASTTFNLITPLQLFVSAKEYIFLWSLYLVLAAGLIRPDLVIRIWTTLPWIMPLQIPVILYQRFIVAPSRRGIGAEWDAVVGIFGGNPMGGGASGAMGLFCVIMMMLVIARWRKSLLPTSHALLLLAGGFISIGMAEIKFAVLLLPLGFILLLRREFINKPLQSVFILIVGLLLSTAVLVGYQAQYDGDRSDMSFSEYFESMFSSSTSGDFVNLETREIGRVAAITFWAHEHSLDQPLELFLGHGAGSSRVGETVVGEAAKPYPFNISRSALAMFLWELGLLGALAFMGMLLVAYNQLYRLSLDARLTPHESTVTLGMAIALVIMAAGAPYNTDLLFSYHMQVMLMLSLGWLAMLNGRLNTPNPWAAQQQRTEPMFL